MDGIRLNDLDALEAFGVDKKKLVEEITRAYAHQIYVDGFFNGDPHPGTLSLSLPSTPPPPLSSFQLELSVGLYQIIFFSEGYFVVMCCNYNLS